MSNEKSDWVLDTADAHQQTPANSSPWRMDTSPPQDETFYHALSEAPYRMSVDAKNQLLKAYNAIPAYYQKAKTEIPGFPETYSQHPKHLAGQDVAGMLEAINQIGQIPHGIAEYLGPKRLNLIGEHIPQAIAELGPPDVSKDINQLFGEPKYPGEAASRGFFRNIPQITGAKSLMDVINPLNYTASNVARSVVNEGNRQATRHNQLYNRLWDDARNVGINNVNFDPHLVNTNANFIRQYTTPRQHESLNEFINHPTLENAQTAQSDLGIMTRALEEKSRANMLTSEERNLYDAASHTQRHIENQMFRDANGNINQPLANRYNALSRSYRENVVPYRYNSDIQAFRNRELTAKELVSRLKHGEFAAKKGNVHPELYRNELLQKALIPLMKGGLYGAGIGGGLGGAYLGYKYLTGNSPE